MKVSLIQKFLRVARKFLLKEEVNTEVDGLIFGNTRNGKLIFPFVKSQPYSDDQKDIELKSSSLFSDIFSSEGYD